jgi:hypothetical protein
LALLPQIRGRGVGLGHGIGAAGKQRVLRQQVRAHLALGDLAERSEELILRDIERAAVHAVATPDAGVGVVDDDAG